jgi:hypothetical protein
MGAVLESGNSRHIIGCVHQIKFLSIRDNAEPSLKAATSIHLMTESMTAYSCWYFFQALGLDSQVQ